VSLEGAGTLELHDRTGQVAEQRALRAGHVVSRPAESGLGHMLRAGDSGMPYLPDGLRRPNEIVFHPRSGQACVGQVMVRFETVDDYWDGEV